MKQSREPEILLTMIFKYRLKHEAEEEERKTSLRALGQGMYASQGRARESKTYPEVDTWLLQERVNSDWSWSLPQFTCPKVTKKSFFLFDKRYRGVGSRDALHGIITRCGKIPSHYGWTQTLMCVSPIGGFLVRFLENISFWLGRKPTGS